MLGNAEKYKQLYKTQDKILKIVANENLGFYLTGGTALQRFYFNEYRYSDDLDLFLLNNGIENANAKDFDLFIQALRKDNIAFKIQIENPYFKQIFLNENNLKIDLVNDYVFHENDFIKTPQGFYIDSIQNILANKLETSISRNEPRDLLDIYTILTNKEIDLQKIFELLAKKTNLDFKDIQTTLKAVNADNIDVDRINFKDENIKKDFIANFHKIFLENFKDVDLKKSQIQAMKEKVKEFTLKNNKALPTNKDKNNELNR